MPSDVVDYCEMNQKAVYWPPTGVDRFAKPTFGTPIEIACRWEDRNVLFINKEGREQTSKAIVFVPVDLVADGILWLGLLANIGSPNSNPFVNLRAWKIMTFNKIPDIDGVQFERRAIL